MSEDMLGALVRKLVDLPLEILGTLYDLLEKMSGESREVWFTALRRFLRKENPWGGVRLAPTHLKLVGRDIRFKTKPFEKNSFFRTDGSPRLYFWPNFTNWVLPAIPKTIPALGIALMKTKLMKSMYDSGILTGLGNPKPFTPSEFAAIIRHLLRGQPKGEEGTLLTNGYANIFYVQLEDNRVVAVHVFWHAGFRDWNFYTYALGGGEWCDGLYVFSRS